VTPLGSFEDWSIWVREAIIWASDYGDPCETIEGVRERDPKRDALVAILTQWKLHIGIDIKVTTDQVVTKADELRSPAQIYNSQGKIPTVRATDKSFYDALLLVADNRRGIVDNKRLSTWIRKNLKRVVDGCRLMEDGNKAGYSFWTLVKN
jgi:hypothetical protein